MSEDSRPILVTGASGFAGRHIVHTLCESGRTVRAMVRRPPQPALHPAAHMVTGDLSALSSYAPLLEGASAVVHAALTDNLGDEPKITTTLLETSARAGVRKFVHLSSIAVYGAPASGTITEETQPLPSADTYSRTKLEIEKALQRTTASIDIAVLRLGCVYGPGNGWWTGGLLNQMQHGKLILVNNGSGTANLVHASDVAAAVVLAIDHAGTRFDVFNITDGRPVAWSRYYAELEKIAGHAATVSMTEAQAHRHYEEWRRPSFVRRCIRKLTGGPIVYPLDQRGIENMASTAVYSNRKAASDLHFMPEYDLDEGMRTVRSGISGEHASHAAGASKSL